jgi:hypothetical protein
MQAYDAVKIELDSRLETLVEHLTVAGGGRAAAFFDRLRRATDAVEDEPDLLEVFFELSTTAFQGFDFDPLAASLIDELLAYAEQVSHAFMASTENPH